MRICRLNAEHPVFRAPLLFIFSITIVCFLIFILHDYLTRVLILSCEFEIRNKLISLFKILLFQAKHGVREIDSKQFQCFSTVSDNSNDFRQNLLRPLLIERVSGTQGNAQARQHIISKLRSTNLWNIDFDTFDAMTPVK